MDMKKMAGAGALAALLALAMPAQAADYTLTDGNSVAEWSSNSGQGQTSQFNWVIDGQDQLYDQDFWFRVGSTGGEARISTLNFVSGGTTDTDFNGDADTLVLNYSGTGFTLQVRYALSGGAANSGSSILSEDITITNTGTSSLDFHFFQYVDFDLGSVVNNDSAHIENDDSVVQTSPNYGSVTESTVNPAYDHYQLGTYPSILNALNDGSATTLSDSSSSLSNTDVSWSFQWDRTIAAGSSFQIAKDKRFQAVPLPPAALAGLGLLGLMGIARRRRRTAA